MTTRQARTPVQEALVTLHEHGLTCPRCQPVWEGEQPVFGECPEADRLYREWRRLNKERRQI